MVKKCSRCGQFKELVPSNFRYMEKQDRYCAYCRACEAAFTREYRLKKRKSHIEKLFLTQTKRANEKEVDELLASLKELWRAQHE